MSDPAGEKKGDTDMPTTYAHDRFGREVYEQLPVNLKRSFEKTKIVSDRTARAGYLLLLPSVLENRVSDYGTFLHEQTASVLFEDEVKSISRARQRRWKRIC